MLPNKKNLWSTPTTFDAHNIKGERKKSTGGQIEPLQQKVRMWPTPTQDSATERTKNYAQGGKPLTVAVKEEQVRMWPTPAAHEARLGYQRRDTGKKGSQKSLTTIVIDKQGGRDAVKGSLNPDWVEWLMGYGQGYTDPDNKDKFTLDSHQGFPNEPKIARVTTENQYRKDRLKALGNSIVPQIAYHIGLAILEQEKT